MNTLIPLATAGRGPPGSTFEDPPEKVDSQPF
jgi:hypothetical protein